ncbi:MAG: hypothetical protein ABIP79_11325 [Chitinophagaceae bacterium]
MQFLKEHLNPGNYEWDSQLIYIGEPTRRLYNRHNGNQLLFIINHFAETTNTFDTKKGVLIQDMLDHELPIDAKSEISVLKWLNEKAIA